LAQNYDVQLQTLLNGNVVPQVGVWVQLVNNDTGTAYVSTGITSGTGKATFSPKPPGDTYVVNISTVSSSGPWVAFGVSNWAVPVIQGENVAMQSITSLVSGPYAPNPVTGTSQINGFLWAPPPTGTDQSAALQALINQLNSAANNALPSLGGTLYLQPGIYFAENLIIPTGVTLAGAGIESTTLTLNPSATTTHALLSTKNFDALTGTNPTSGADQGPWNFGIRDITLEGNKANNASNTAVGLVRIYGYGYLLHNVRLRNSNTIGLFAQWSNTPTQPALGDAMEAQWVNLKVHDCVGDGVNYQGPHDSAWTNGIVYNNGAIGINCNGNGNGLLMCNVHSWGQTHTYAAFLGASGCGMVTCVLEGASVAQLAINATDCWYMGGQIFAALAAVPVGIVIGPTAPAAGYNIHTKVINCTTAAIKYTSDSGLGSIRVIVYAASGPAESGASSSSTFKEIIVSGGATGGTMVVPSGMTVANDFVMANGKGFTSANATDTFLFKPGGAVAFQIESMATAVNFVSTRAASTGNAVNLGTLDSGDASSNLTIDTKGSTSSLFIRPGSLSALQITGVATAVNGFQLLNAVTLSGPTLKAIGSDTDISINLTPKGAGVVNLNYATVALGGGAAPTVGTIGGSGPATAAQNSWLKLQIAGTTSYVPVWR
jgi:hypothetical protein